MLTIMVGLSRYILVIFKYKNMNFFESYNLPGPRERNFSHVVVCGVSPGGPVMKKCSP